MIFRTHPKYEQALLSTLLYIQTHLEPELSLEGLADRVGFSAFHFHRIFRETIGEAVKEYIRRLRIERGTYRLKISEASILQIALDAGFKTHESFTRAFKRQFGMTPSAFRSDFMRLSHERKKRVQPQYLSDYNLQAESGLLPNWSTAVQVRVEPVRSIIVAFVRHVGPYERLLDPGSPMSALWEELFHWGNANRLINAASLLIGLPQDDPSVTPLTSNALMWASRSPNSATLRATLAARRLRRGSSGWADITVLSIRWQRRTGARL
jgi:AraC family transcriptional regulator